MRALHLRGTRRPFLILAGIIAGNDGGLNIRVLNNPDDSVVGSPWSGVRWSGNTWSGNTWSGSGWE